MELYIFMYPSNNEASYYVTDKDANFAIESTGVSLDRAYALTGRQDMADSISRAQVGKAATRLVYNLEGDDLEFALSLLGCYAELIC